MVYVQNNDPSATDNGQDITVASSMGFQTSPVVGEAGQQFPTQPSIKVMDTSVSIVTPIIF